MPRMRVYQTLAEKQAAYRRRQGIPERPHYPSHAAKIAAYRQRKRQRRRSAWTTPPDLFHKLDQEFHFTLDVAADPDNALCPRYYTPQDDGLAQPWEGVCWCNPPYGRGEIARWVQKASESAQAGAKVVCLLPVRTATQWWH